VGNSSWTESVHRAFFQALGGLAPLSLTSGCSDRVHGETHLPVLAETCSAAPGTSEVVKSMPLTASDKDQSSWQVLGHLRLHSMVVAAGAVFAQIVVGVYY
jgi:hypothetical protein